MARGLSLWGEGIVTEADRGSTLAPMEEGRFAVVTDGPSGNQMFVLDAFGQELSVKDIAVPLSFGSYSVVNLYYADVGIAYVDNTLAGDGDLRFLEQGEYSRVLDDSTANDTSVGDVEATAGGGGYWVIWTRQEPGGTSVLMRKFDSSSDAASPEVVVRAAAQYVAVPELAVLKNGNVVAFWRAGDTDDALALSLRVWNAQGSPISAEIQVNAEAQSTRPVVEALANGNFVVTWQNVGQGGIYHQVFDASGAAVSSRQFQNADTGTLPKITALPDGGYVLGWTDLRLDSGGDPVVVLQRFDATSAIDGERFVLSTMGTVNLQGFATLSDGRIALTTWSETDMFSDNFDVRYYIIETRSFEIDGSEGEDDLVGGVGDSQLNGFGGYDRLTGMDGDDTLSGHAGDDTLEAGGGDDLVRGGSGGDMLGGGQGDDTLEGGSGDDYLAGDSGADRMVGGSGNDRYDLTSSV
ncbi:MAG TPA: calcium-binding protein, partial [Ramlibacter sp.]